MKKSMHKIAILCGFLSFGAIDQAFAIPSFARQTGLDCTACHTVFPNLTEFGRQFKLRGYTQTGGDSSMPVPVAAMAFFTYNKATSANSPDPKREGSFQLGQAALFYGGKITDHIGTMAQITYYGGALPQNQDVANHTAADNTDIRYANTLEVADKEMVYGVSVNNNPTLSDVWNSTPAGGFNYDRQPITQIEGLGGFVAGSTAYAEWNDMLYAEFGAYRSARKGPLAIFAWNDYKMADPGNGDSNDMYGNAPYARVAIHKTFGNNTIMLGGYGLNEKTQTFISKGPFTQYQDRGVDAQYQYVNDDHIIEAVATQIWETQRPDGGDKSTISVTDATASYYYKQKYGVSYGYFSNVQNGVEQDKGRAVTLYYLPLNNVRLSAYYKMYDKASDSGLSKASDKNSVGMMAFFAF